MAGVHEFETMQLAWNGNGKSTCPGRIVRFSMEAKRKEAETRPAAVYKETIGQLTESI
jgi:hypothetical protein